MDKKEGGESQLDVGGKNGHRLSPIHYTLIAEIKGFRFNLERTVIHQEEINTRKRYQVPGRPAPIHSALIDWSQSREVMA
jgi:hypothetical protein